MKHGRLTIRATHSGWGRCLAQRLGRISTFRLVISDYIARPLCGCITVQISLGGWAAVPGPTTVSSPTELLDITGLFCDLFSPPPSIETAFSRKSQTN